MVVAIQPESRSFSQERIRLRSRCRPRSLQNAYPRFSQARLGLRSYSPALGRWLSRDLIGERGGVDLYGFCANHSVNAVDPDGQTELHVGGALAADVFMPIFEVYGFGFEGSYMTYFVGSSPIFVGQNVPVRRAARASVGVAHSPADTAGWAVVGSMDNSSPVLTGIPRPR